MSQSGEITVTEAVHLTVIPPRARVLVAVSGGPDSIALLDALHVESRTKDRGWMLRVAHVNHSLRGEEGETDEGFVTRIARDRGLEAEIARADVPHAAREQRISIETAAREERY